MNTIIRTVHEEEYTNGEKTLGVLFNYPEDNGLWKESFVYVYKDGMYIFFDTIINMIDYLLYGEKKMRRAYMEEKEFDEYYDADFINGKFTDKLTWTN